MINIVAIIVGFIFVYIVYLGLCRNGFMLGYILNFLYTLINYYLKNSEITMLIMAKVFLVAAIVTFLEYIAYKKSESFIGFLVYIVLIVVGIAIVIALTKALFTFLGNPSMLFEK